MPTEQNRAVARRVLDVLVSQGRLEVVDQISAQAFEFRDPTAGQTITTHQGLRDLGIVSEYVVVDRLGLLRQLGMAPASKQPST